MIKQIKTKLLSFILASFIFFNNCAMIPFTEENNIIINIEETIEQSDVVENKSVTEEQICETPMLEKEVSNKVVTNTQEEVYIENDATETTFDLNESSYEEQVAVNFIDYEIPNHQDFKSYMGYKAITKQNSLQYLLQQNYAYTGLFGIRQINDRFCIALGSYFTISIGQYCDLILENGLIIPCILGDVKANQHTDNQNLFSSNGCCSEFIVDSQILENSAKNSGNMSNICEAWNSPVKYVRVYDINILD